MMAAEEQYRVMRDADSGRAFAIARGPLAVLDLLPGTKINEENADRLVDELNAGARAREVLDEFSARVKAALPGDREPDKYRCGFCGEAVPASEVDGSSHSVKAISVEGNLVQMRCGPVRRVSPVEDE